MAGQTVTLSITELLYMGSGLIVSYILTAWALGGILFKLFTQRIDKIDGKDGRLDSIEEHIDLVDERSRDQHRELEARVSKIEERSVSEREVREIFREAMTPINEGIQSINQTINTYAAEQRAKTDAMADQLSKVQASIAVLNDRDKRRRSTDQE